jgi:hypothetical protein
MTDNSRASIPLACDLSAMMPDERSRHSTVVADWRSLVVECVELPDGFAYRFAPDDAILLTLAEFIARERLCCPFFRFQLDLLPGGPLWLRLSGPDGAKELLAGFFGAG